MIGGETNGGDAALFQVYTSPSKCERFAPIHKGYVYTQKEQ
jgi:hypothetical protein